MNILKEMLILSASAIIVGTYWYRSRIGSVFHNFPEQVAKPMRQAIYHSRYSVDRDKAIIYFEQALAAASKCGMDPLSPEVLGIKVDFAGFYERIGEERKAILVLESIRKDCLSWIDRSGNENPGTRNRLLQLSVRAAVRLGQLYGGETMQQNLRAEERLTEAVECQLREVTRRQIDGVTDGEGPWMTMEEMGATYEALADHYETTNQHYLASPLYIQALAHLPPSNCHSVTLMSSLAVSLLLQSPPPSPNSPDVSESQAVSSARSWAEKALALSQSVDGPDRTEECDIGCANALINLGDLAIMEGDSASARRYFGLAREKCRQLKWDDGLRKAIQGFKSIDKR
ncbi:hypothetical protein MMC25_005568 [Agyrium rufum]|nr:hypothetical protein [Agyrium rufum]